MSRIFICTTCDRYAPRPAGEISPGLRLARAIKHEAETSGHAVAVRMVECLNTCPQSCAAALRDPGKAVLRFGHLNPADAPALVAAAEAYANSAGGDLADNALPGRLKQKLAGRVMVGFAETGVT